MDIPWYKKGKYHVGSMNYDEELLQSFDLPEDKRIKVVDSTIRKLESTPGVRLSVRDKVEIALATEKLGSDEIYINNLHFVPEYFDSAKAIAQEKTKLWMNVQTWLTEDWKKGVDKSIEAGADNSEVEARTSNTELLRLGLTKAGMTQRLCEALDYGKERGADMTAGFMDSTRADFYFLLDLLNQALEHGASKLILYDSFGALSPFALQLFLRRIRKNLIRQVPIVIHVHNMFGLGSAGEIGGVTGGASHVDVSAIGTPSNCPLAPLDETVLSLELLLGLKTGIMKENIYEYCKFIEEKSGINIAPYKAVIGDQIFLFESDNEVAEYYRGSKVENLKPFIPEIVGRKAHVIWGINTLRGDSVRAKLENMRLDYTEHEVKTIINEISERLDSKKEYPIWLSETEVEKICNKVVEKSKK